MSNENMGILSRCNLDNANWHLRQGSATEAEANAFVEWWNTPGNRLTRAEVKTRSLPFGNNGWKLTEIILHED
jgi:hypothetical protein